MLTLYNPCLRHRIQDYGV
ncbi:Protein of unknown function [Pyronema omphalodes CBS 100304]|uniref:Uncharacterized protein n=1 Tax=Pyronema omphalodes (strain CBS 100304) TaxID=1076935 RepID=U4LHI3_PYROM|nr:Protein of unknown function [Pyronema omphalodes CBS 100304]